MVNALFLTLAILTSVMFYFVLFNFVVDFFQVSNLKWQLLSRIYSLQLYLYTGILGIIFIFVDHSSSISRSLIEPDSSTCSFLGGVVLSDTRAWTASTAWSVSWPTAAIWCVNKSGVRLLPSAMVPPAIWWDGGSCHLLTKIDKKERKMGEIHEYVWQKGTRLCLWKFNWFLWIMIRHNFINTLHSHKLTEMTIKIIR